MHWSDGNLHALDAYLAEQEHDDEECEICGEYDCDCAENIELDRGDYLLGLKNDT